MITLISLFLLFLVACAASADDNDDDEIVSETAVSDETASGQRTDGAIKLDISLGGSVQNGSFSPDSSQVLFTNFHDGYNIEPANLHIFTLASGTLTTLVGDGSGNINLPGSSWNAATGLITFASTRDPHDEIFIIPADGQSGDETAVTQRPGLVAYEPTFSPDGEWIVFESHLLDVEEGGVITRYKVDGSGEYEALTAVSDDARQPNYSPAGDLILYQRLAAGQWNIWVMDVDGANPRQVTSGSGDKTDAAFSPDGSYIVYSSDSGGLEFANLFIIPVSGGEPTRVTQYNTGYDGAPSWSPDGEWIVFESSEGEPDDSAGTTLWKIAAPAISSSGNVYTVATNGDNGNVGSEAEPWLTIQHAADTVQPGDMVQVRGGTYAETVAMNVSGSAAGGFITFKSYAGETAVIDGTGFTSANGDVGMYIEDQNYLIIDGFEIRNYKSNNANAVPMGIFVTGASHHIQLLNNHIHHIETNAGSDGNAHGLAVYGSSAPASINNIIVQGNELNNMKLGNSEAMVLNGNVEQFTVTQNVVHDNDNIGIDLIGFESVSPDSAFDQARDGTVSENVVYNINSLGNPAYFGEQSAAGIYVDGGTRIVLERNHVYDSNMGIEIASEHQGRATSYITVRNNLLVHNHIAGLAMGGYDTNRGSTEHCVIVNNTFFENDSNQDGNGELWMQFDVRDNVVQNNIFVANAQSWLMTNPYTQNQNNIVDYNIYFAPAGNADSEWQWKNSFYQGFAAYQAGSGNDAHSLFIDPQFVNTAVSDFHLSATSPAIDIGTNLSEAGSVDFDGRIRTFNGTIDLGAFEFGAETAVYLPLITITSATASTRTVILSDAKRQS